MQAIFVPKIIVAGVINHAPTDVLSRGRIYAARSLGRHALYYQSLHVCRGLIYQTRLFGRVLRAR